MNKILAYKPILDKLKSEKSFLIPLAIYTVLFLFFCSKLSPLYPTNEWGDINVYFNVGKGMFSGMTLYSEIFDHKGPLIFIIYGLGSLVSNSSFIGVFIIFVAMWIVAMFATFFTAKLFLKDSNAFILTLLCPIVYRGYILEGGSAEEIIMLLAIISIYFFVKYFIGSEAKHKPLYMFIHGVLSSATLMIKLNLVVFWFFPLLFIFLYLLYKKEYKNFLQNCVAYLIGFCTILVPICLYFIANGALAEAYQVYIELNKEYAASSTNDYAYLISNGFRKVYSQYKGDLIWYIILSLGFIYFPFKYFKNKLAATSFMLAGVSLILIIFFPLTFHLYYPLPFLCFAGVGLIVVFSFLERYMTINWSKKLSYFFIAFCLLFTMNKTDFFGLGGANLLRIQYPNGPQFIFKEYLDAEDNPTLLNLSFQEGNALFTTAGITPTVKYFFCPNFYYEMFPYIRDNQAKYIENKETMFVIRCDQGYNVEFFDNFEPLKQNYTEIATCDLGVRSFTLYKRNNNK